MTFSEGKPEVKARKGEMIAWAFYDWANNAFATIILTFVFAAYFTGRVASGDTVGTAQWGNALGIAGLIVGLTGPFLGAIADQGGRLKRWIASFTMLCVAATAMLWFVRPDTNPHLALLLVGIGMVGSEFAMIFYNSLLPTLVPEKKTGRWSGWGWAMGYAGGLLCLILSLVLFVGEESSFPGLDRSQSEHVRATFLLAASWYFLFALPFLIFTPDIPATGKRMGDKIKGGLRRLLDSVKKARRYSPLLRFLIGRMIYIDGLATVFSFGGVFAAGTFDMTEQEVLMFGITINVTAGLGAAAFAWIDDFIGPRKTIIGSLLGLLFCGTMMLVAPTEKTFWIFGLLLGIFVGPVQASSRSYLARSAPRDLRSQMFGLYALSGKATAFLGPLSVGWITYAAGSQRVGMSMVLLFFLGGLIMILTVPAARKTLEMIE